MPLCDGGAIRLYELGLKDGAELGLERDMPEGVATGVGCIVSIDASEEGDEVQPVHSLINILWQIQKGVEYEIDEYESIKTVKGDKRT